MRSRPNFTILAPPQSPLHPTAPVHRATRCRTTFRFGNGLLTAALAWLALGSSPAQAQLGESIVLNTDRIERIGPLRPTGRLPHWISYSDCINNEVISFPLTPSTTAYTLEVWVGTSDCVALRSSTNDRQQCWLVASDSSPDRQRYSIDVPVRNVVARRTNLSDKPPVDLPEEVCRESTETNGQNLTYYFMLVGGGNAQASATWGGGTGAAAGGQANTGFDVVGPAPPDSIRIGLGESDLSIEIDDPGENSDRSRFQAYCVSEQAAASLQQAGSLDDAGTSVSSTASVEDAGFTALNGGSRDAGLQSNEPAIDGGTQAEGAVSPSSDAGTVVSTCNQTLLVPKQRPPDNVLFECGEAGTSARSMRTSQLVNGRTYAVAVAGEDLLGNVGPLSNVECAAPVLLEDFYESYRRQGGRGGGGFCSIQPGQPKRPAPLWGLGLSLIALIVMRRRSTKQCA